MDVGVTIGYVIGGIFLLVLLSIFGFTLYVFFKKLKVFLGVKLKTKQTQSQEKKPINGSFCSKCGIQLGEKVSFCSGCGEKVK